MSPIAPADFRVSPPSGEPLMDVRDATSWVASLPLGDSATTAGHLYQAISEINRRELDPGRRLDLMELYAQPVAAVSAALQAPWVFLQIPMAPKARQQAEFLRDLHREMARGYQCVLRDLLRARNVPENRGTVCRAAERAIHQLIEVLLRSYQGYMPVPGGTWKEIHSLFRLVEEHGLADHPVDRQQDGLEAALTVRNSYLRALLLGICGPYQLPQNMCLRINAFLVNGSRLATVAPRAGAPDSAGRFLVDLAADSPARSISKDAKAAIGPNLRVLGTSALVRTVCVLAEQLHRGETLPVSKVGFECTDGGCLDVLWHMIRFWENGAYRRYPRRGARDPELSLCVGLKLLHFFSGARQPQFSQAAAAKEGAGDDNAEVFIDLESGASFATILQPDGERFEADHWKIRDESASGLALMRGGSGVSVHVGALIGLRGPDASGWNVGMVRWLRSPDVEHVEIGVKLLGPAAVPVTVKLAGGSRTPGSLVPALQLAAVAAENQPPTLLIERGQVPVGGDFDLLDAEGSEAHRMRVLKVIRRTSSFEQMVCAPLVSE